METTAAPRASRRARLAEHGSPDPNPVAAQPTVVAPEPSARPEAWDRDRSELDAAIAMVADGYANRVVITGLQAPEAAAAALAMAAAGRGVGLDLKPTADGNVAIVARHS